MLCTKVLLSIAAFAGTSLSQKMDTEFCFSALTSLYSIFATELPTTPTPILDFIATNTQIPTFAPALTPGASLDGKGHQSQLDVLATALPSSLLPEFKTLIDGLLSFGKARNNDLIGYATNCAPEDEIAASTSYFNSFFTFTGQLYGDVIMPTPSGASDGAQPTPIPTPAPTATSALNTSAAMIPTAAAAARPTGAWFGAAAVGGVLGAAALL